MGQQHRSRAFWAKLVPTAVAAATYLGLHSLLDYGTFGADVYADPLHAPLGWLKWVKFRLPKLATGALWDPGRDHLGL